MSDIRVLTNPRSRRNRRNPAGAETLSRVLGGRGCVVAPTDLAALADAASTFRGEGAEVLCVNGGDGTLHQAVTAMIRAYGTEVPLPPVAILPGGTMNIIADSIGVSVSAEAMLEQVVAARNSGVPLPERRVPTLQVEIDDQPPHYGFLSGNGIIARFLELYYAGDEPTPMDAATLLAKGAASAVVGGNLARDLTRPWQGRVLLDGQAWPHEAWVAVAIGTVEQMGLGFRVFSQLTDHPDRLQVVGISGTVGQLARDLPSLYRGQGVTGPHNLTDVAQVLELVSDTPQPLMIDGDFYAAARGRVRYRLGPDVRFLLPR